MTQTPLDPLLLRIARHIETVVGADNIRDVRRWATIDPTAEIAPTAEVYNFLRDPRAITIGAHALIRGELAVFRNGGRIHIGDGSIFGKGSRIWSQSSVSIGNHVGIGHLVDIHDTNGHPIDWQQRRLEEQAILEGTFRADTKTVSEPIPTKTVSQPIVVEDDAWIAFKATILKGVHIGRGAIVAAGSVVVKDVPAWTMVAGNPARVVRQVTEVTSASLL